jgi:large subunit ribosomal protein L22
MRILRDTTFATSKYIRVSPIKMRVALLKLKGKSYKEALAIVGALPLKVSSIIWQTLYSAVNNGVNNYGFKKENIVIIESFVNKGPILKRQRERARGRSFAIEKNVSHLTIVISGKA